MPLQHSDAGEMPILRSSVREIAGKIAVSMILRTLRGEECEALIWLTDKSMGMARGQLKACGFDVDRQSLEEIDMDPRLLEGNRVTIATEDYKGRVQAKIVFNSKPQRSEMARATEALRAAKSFAEEAEPPDDGDGPPPIADSDQIPY